jgi:hypothetical protein
MPPPKDLLGLREGDGAGFEVRLKGIEGIE